MLETDGDGHGARAERAVHERYAAGAQAREDALCCPVDYDTKLLEAIPQEVIDRDYGCGDPTRHLREGEVVLDLGSGTGKACFMAAQVVGAQGRVIGVDFNDDMLAVARRHAPTVAERVGFDVVEFRKGRIQDLRLDRARLAGWLVENPVTDDEGLTALEERIAELRAGEPLVASASVDVVVSNCVLNLVRPENKEQMFREIDRVLREGGRAVISDIVCDEDVPAHLQADEELWSGCVSGAFREDAFLHAFENAGFLGVEIVERQAEPWRVVEGIEFRSLTVQAFKGKEGPSLDWGHAVVYRGPFSAVSDDDGHVFHRGQRMAVCEKTFDRFSCAPYREHVELVEPLDPVPRDRAPEFPREAEGRIRHPRETKGKEYRETIDAGDRCPPAGDESGCC